MKTITKKVLEGITFKELFTMEYQEWPPKPLKCSNFHDSRFKAYPKDNYRLKLYTLGMGTIQLQKILINAPFTYKSVFAANPMGYSDLKGFIEFKNRIKVLVRSNFLAKRITKFCFNFVIFPWVTFLTVKNIKVSPASNFEDLGLAIVNSKSIMFLNIEHKDFVPSVIGHEAIHLLQNQNKNLFRERIENGLQIEKLLKLDVFMTTSQSQEEFIKYIYSAHEVEARLHQVMVFWYKNKKELPITKIGFLAAIFSFSFCSLLLKNISESNSQSELKELIVQIKEYSIKNNLPWAELKTEKQLDIEMKIILTMVKVPILIIKNYLPNRYANLLGLYGATDERLAYEATNI